MQSGPLTESVLMEQMDTIWAMVGPSMPSTIMISKPAYKKIKRWLLIFDGVPLRIGKHKVKVRQRNNRWQVVHS